MKIRLTDEELPLWIAILVAAQTVLSVVLVIVVILLATEASNLGNTVRKNQYDMCVSGNETRLKTEGIINSIINLPAVSDPQFQKPALRSLQLPEIMSLKTEVKQNYNKQNNCAPLK